MGAAGQLHINDPGLNRTFAKLSLTDQQEHDESPGESAPPTPRALRRRKRHGKTGGRVLEHPLERGQLIESTSR